MKDNNNNQILKNGLLRRNIELTPHPHQNIRHQQHVKALVASKSSDNA